MQLQLVCTSLRQQAASYVNWHSTVAASKMQVTGADRYGLILKVLSSMAITFLLDIPTKMCDFTVVRISCTVAHRCSYHAGTTRHLLPKLENHVNEQVGVEKHQISDIVFYQLSGENLADLKFIWRLPSAVEAQTCDTCM